MTSTSIVIVDDNHQTRDILMHAFGNRGYITWTCPGDDLIIGLLAAVRPAIVIIDLDIVGLDAIELMNAWKTTAPETRILMKTATADHWRKTEALSRGADAFVESRLGLAALFDFVEHHTPREKEKESMKLENVVTYGVA